MHRQLLIGSNGMGVGLTGLKPSDVADLTWFQVENDYVSQLIKVADMTSSTKSNLRPVPREDEAQELPAYDVWAASLRSLYPGMKEAEIRRQYDELKNLWGE
jgi:hypothetical protein